MSKAQIYQLNPPPLLPALPACPVERSMRWQSRTARPRLEALQDGQPHLHPPRPACRRLAGPTAARPIPAPPPVAELGRRPRLWRRTSASRAPNACRCMLAVEKGAEPKQGVVQESQVVMDPLRRRWQLQQERGRCGGPDRLERRVVPLSIEDSRWRPVPKVNCAAGHRRPARSHPTEAEEGQQAKDQRRESQARASCRYTPRPSFV
ncbi:hypothetical protein C8T65DRAFT_125138 [Cerioporus squamosus]|nr:hypothetical protein C8T65DRAFT_125138 [Cerioporus squamosus]